MTNNCIACAGANYLVDLSDCKYPLSLTPNLVDQHDNILKHGQETKALGQFKVDQIVISPFWGIPKMNADVGALLNEEVEKLKGEAVVNLTMTNKDCFTNYLPLVSILPIWPGCRILQIDGTVVRRKNEQDLLEDTSPLIIETKISQQKPAVEYCRKIRYNSGCIN